MFLFSFQFVQHISDFNFPRIADFGAAISGANKLQCQQVLEELDVSTTQNPLCWWLIIIELTFYVIHYQNLLKSRIQVFPIADQEYTFKNTSCIF